MASVQLHKTTEKGLNQGYYGGGSSFGQKVSDMANWAYNKAAKRENRYHGAAQNGYSMSYSESECYSQLQRPSGMKESQAAYGMSKTKVNGHGNGFGSHGNAQVQGYGCGNQTSPGKGPNHGYGSTHGYSNHANHEATGAYVYGSTQGGQKYNGVGHGFSDHGNYGYDESNGFGNYSNNGMGHSQGHRPGHSGHGQELIRAQAYGPGKKVDYDVTATETRVYAKTETRYSNESRYYSGGRAFPAAGNIGSHCMRRPGCGPTCNGMNCRGMTKNMGDHRVKGLLGNCSDDSDSDVDEYGRKKVYISKAI